MITTAFHALRTLPEILLILWAAFVTTLDALAQLQACLSVLVRKTCDAVPLRRAKTLLLVGGILQWISCALLDLTGLGSYAFGATAFLLMADTALSMPAALVVSFRKNEGEPGNVFQLTRFTGFQYLLSVLFCFSLWLSILWKGDGQEMSAQFIGSIHQFAVLFMFGALGSAAVAVIAAFVKNKDATLTARQALTSCFVFGLILFLMEWLFS